MDPDALPTHLAVLERAVLDESAVWSAGFPVVSTIAQVPDPRLPGGLPAGWAVRAHHPNYGADDTGLFLVRRESGGWMLVRYESDLRRARIEWIDSSLAALHVSVTEGMVEGWKSPAEISAIHRWLSGVLLSLFDEADPVEASEKVLFALSGTLTCPPRLAG